MQEQLDVQIAQTLEDARIQVTEQAFANITIHIGDATSTLAEDLSSPVFYRTPKGIRYGPPSGEDETDEES